MRTHTAPWDYERNVGIAPMTEVCPICAGPCYSGLAPDGKFYTCPKCHTINAQDVKVLEAAARIVAERDAILFDAQDEADRQAEIHNARYGH